MKKLIICGCAVAALFLASCASKDKKTETAVPEAQAAESARTAADTDAPIIESLKSEKGLPVVVDFYADWCGPCRQFRPIFEKAEKTYAGKIDFRSVDVDAEQALASECNIEYLPTIFFLDKDGRLKGSFSGFMDEKQFTESIEMLLADAG